MEMKRIFSLFGGIVLFVLIILNTVPSVHANSNEGYHSVIEDYALDCGYSNLKEPDQKKCKGLLYDLDGDGQDELIVQYLKKRSTAYSVWTIENGAPVCVLDDPYYTGRNVIIYVTKYNGKSFFVLNSCSTGSDGNYLEWLFYDVANKPYQLAYNLGEGSNYDGSGSSRNIVNKTGDGSTYAQVYSSLETKVEIPFESTAKTFDVLLEAFHQGNAIKDEHPYIPIIRETIEYTKSVYSWSDGYGTLCDIDNNGIKELIMVFSGNAAYNEAGIVPATVYSVYTMNDNKVIPLIEQEVLYVDVGAPVGFVAIAEKGGKKYIATTYENREVGPISYKKGKWTVMSVNGISLGRETEISYKEVYSYEENTLLYNESYAVINGTQCDYRALEAWIDEIDIIVSVAPHYATEQDKNVLTLLELLDCLRKPPVIEDEYVSAEIPSPIAKMAWFNNFFVGKYYDNLNKMYQYDSVAKDILDNSTSFQINWNSCLSALSNKEFLDVLKFENHPEYYYQTVLFESIMQTKLNDDYWSALTSQIGQISLDAISYYVKYDANFTSYEKILKQKLNTTMTDFSIDSVQYKRLSDYYGQYCNQLKTYDTVKDIYDLTVKADGTVEDFFNALSNYACIYNTTEEIVSALEYLKLHLEGSTNEEDQYILTAVNNILASLDRTLNEQLVLNCLGTAKNLLWGVFWAAISDAFPGALALDIASFTIDSGLALSNVFFPTTISADSYCKLYADYAIEVVTREAFKKAYTDYSTNPSDELATITVGLYDLLGYTYAHEIEVAAVLSEQLHKDGLINGLKNLFSSENISTYKYEQACIKAYEAYLNEIASVKVEAQTSYGLAIGTMQPVVTVYFVNGKVAALNEVAINTGDIYYVSSGEFPLPDFVGLRIEIEGYYLDQQFNNAYEEAAINKPLSLYCNLLLTKVSDGTPVLFDHSTGISVSSEESMPKHTLSTSAVTSGNVYSSVEERFTDSEFELYDICLIENGVQVQPSGEATVEIPANPNYANRKAKVYHVTANREFEDMNATSSDGVLQFTTTHFSYYVVVYENAEPTWLIPIVIAVVVCGIGVSLFIILKTRKKKYTC